MGEAGMYRALELQQRTLHAVFDDLRDLRSTLQALTRTELTSDLLDQINNNGRQKLARFRDDWLSITKQHMSEVEADHNKRGLGNSTLVIGSKHRVYQDSLKHLIEVEREFGMFETLVISKRRLLDPAIA